MSNSGDDLNKKSENWNSWTWQQQNAVRDFGKLKVLLPWVESNVEQTSQHFQFQVTPYYFQLIDRNDPNDPIAKICIPTNAEMTWQPEERPDPIGDRTKNEDMDNSPTRAIVHRYSDRCLLFLTPLCSSYCRYCFRREIVSKSENSFNTELVDKSIDYIQHTPELKEVILSGGDPLTIGDKKLISVLQRLAAIPHIRTLRIHTRFPVFNPFRVTDELANGLSALEKPMWLMVHVTHPREVTPEFKQAMKKLQRAGVGLINQGVLVKGCNDDVEILKELSYKLSDCGVLPHYMHTMDLAQGTSHFRVPLDEARAIMKQLRGHLPGHLIPNLILDIPGGYGKIPLEESFVKEINRDGKRLTLQVESTHVPNKILTYEEVLIAPPRKNEKTGT